MKFWFAIAIAWVLTLGAICANYCDAKSIDQHACCPHKKTAPNANVSCNATTDKSDLPTLVADLALPVPKAPSLLPVIHIAPVVKSAPPPILQKAPPSLRI